MSTAACVNPSVTTFARANLRGDVGCTTIASNPLRFAHEISEAAGATIASNAHVYGPFEAGFGAQQQSIIQAWGCADASVAYDTAGGLDLGVAHAKVASACGIALPRISGSSYVGITGSCGGHTGNYHFHGGFECFETYRGTHSPKVGEAGRWSVYGAFEDYDGGKYPLLDACGGHFGTTPESSTSVYHYHIQRDAPFTVGCHGPNSSGGLVTVAQCRALYTECSGTTSTFTINGTSVTYMRDCPCFDAQGKNYGTPVELPAIGASATSYDVSAWSCRSLNNGYNGCLPTLTELTGTAPSSGTAAAPGSPSPPPSPPPSSSPTPSPPPSSSARAVSRNVAAITLLLVIASAATA